MNKKATVVGLLVAVLAATTVVNAEDQTTIDARHAIVMISDKALDYQALYEQLKESSQPMVFFDELNAILDAKEKELNAALQREVQEYIKTKESKGTWKHRLTDWATDEGEWRTNHLKECLKRIGDIGIKIKTLAVMHGVIANARTSTMRAITLDFSYAPEELLELTFCLSKLEK